MAYRFTARRRAALKRASIASARKRSRGGKAKKPYAKRIGARNRNGKFATKGQRRRNVARKVGTGVAIGAYVAANAYAARSTHQIEKRKRAKIREQGARKVAHYNAVAARYR